MSNLKRGIDDFFTNGNKRRRMDMSTHSEHLYDKFSTFMDRLSRQEDELFNKLSNIENKLNKFNDKIENLEKRITFMSEKFSNDIVILEERIYENIKENKEENNFFDYAVS